MFVIGLEGRGLVEFGAEGWACLILQDATCDKMSYFLS